MAWSDVLDQEFTKRIWRTHLSTGRVANAYLLVGPGGIGKRRLAFEMAKALNCISEGERPCDTCITCGQIIRQVHPDVHVVIPAGASNQIGIEETRQLIGRMALRPFNARVQVAIIDGADRLTLEAANSLLKALEEPSPHTKFLLTTAQFGDCLPTITSRCQAIRCRPLSNEVVAKMLVEQHNCQPQTARAIARLSGGSMMRAMGLTQRWTEYQEVVKLLSSDQPADVVASTQPETRETVAGLLDVLLAWLRDMLVVATAEGTPIAHAGQVKVLQRQARSVDPDRCLQAAFDLLELRESIEQFANPRLAAALAREKWLTLREAKSA